MDKKISVELTLKEFALVLNVIQLFVWQSDEVFDKAHINTKKKKNIYFKAVEKMERSFERFGEED